MVVNRLDEERLGYMRVYLQYEYNNILNFPLPMRKSRIYRICKSFMISEKGYYNEEHHCNYENLSTNCPIVTSDVQETLFTEHRPIAPDKKNIGLYFTIGVSGQFSAQLLPHLCSNIVDLCLIEQQQPKYITDMSLTIDASDRHNVKIEFSFRL